MTNYRSPSFDPKTGLFYRRVRSHSYSIYFAKPADGAYGWAGADYGLWGKAVIEAIDYKTGKIRWAHELGPGAAGSGVLTTDSGLTFTGDALGNFLALDTATGKTLWHAGSGANIQSSPITYDRWTPVSPCQRGKCAIRLGPPGRVLRKQTMLWQRRTKIGLYAL